MHNTHAINRAIFTNMLTIAPFDVHLKWTNWNCHKIALFCVRIEAPPKPPTAMGRFHADSHIWLKVKSIEQIHTVERIYEHFPRPSSHKTQIDVSSVKLFVLVATFWKIFQGRHLLEKSVTRRKEQNTYYVSLWDYFQRILKSNEKICTPSKWFWGFNNPLQLLL